MIYKEFGSLACTSFSFATFMAIDEWSNNNITDQGELFGKKLVAAAVYLALPVVALVEAVVRGVFALFAAMAAPCLGDWFIEEVFGPLSGGAAVSLASIIFSLEGFVFNFSPPTGVVSGDWRSYNHTKELDLPYYKQVKMAINGLRERQWRINAMTIGTLLVEFPAALRAGVDMVLYGWSDTPHFSDINPTTLKPHQLNMPPVLCIHGNYHHPSGYTALAAALKEAHDPAIFTVRLNHGEPTEEDWNRVDQRIGEIEALYEEQGASSITVDLIGHSRGAYVADWVSARNGVGRVVLLGYHGSSLQEGKVYEINGVYDALIGNPSTAAIPTGHLGILYDPMTHQQVIKLLESNTL